MTGRMFRHYQLLLLMYYDKHQRISDIGIMRRKWRSEPRRMLPAAIEKARFFPMQIVYSDGRLSISNDLTLSRSNLSKRLIIDGNERHAFRNGLETGIRALGLTSEGRSGIFSCSRLSEKIACLKDNT